MSGEPPRAPGAQAATSALHLLSVVELAWVSRSQNPERRVLGRSRRWARYMATTAMVASPPRVEKVSMRSVAFQRLLESVDNG